MRLLPAGAAALALQLLLQLQSRELHRREVQFFGQVGLLLLLLLLLMQWRRSGRPHEALLESSPRGGGVRHATKQVECVLNLREGNLGARATRDSAAEVLRSLARELLVRRRRRHPARGLCKIRRGWGSSSDPGHD
jgi:hypothetical protein